MAASNLVPSITAAHADLFVPADRAISPPTGKFISPPHSRGTFTINRPPKEQLCLEYLPQRKSTAEMAATGNRQKHNHMMTISADTKANHDNRWRSGTKSCFYVKAQWGEESWNEYYLKISPATSGFAVCDYFISLEHVFGLLSRSHADR